MLEHEQYIEHPKQVPVQLETSIPAPVTTINSNCYGGIRCLWHSRIPVGKFVRISLPQIHPEFFAIVQVIWRRLAESGYELGLIFIDKEQAYKMRMMEQLCHINCYQRWIFEHEGRQLDSEQAASEWIGKFAAAFPKAVA